MKTVAECAKLLGEAIANDEAVKAFNAAKKAFEEDADLQSAIREYNVQRMLLGQEFAKDADSQSQELIATLQTRIDELYLTVTESSSYILYNQTQEGVSALMQQVNSDINFYAFGERPCTHDCSTCSSGCASKQ
ncbi:MAG: YlbF family regulator [Clostridia bacterium]|nr:YlbF family regulator [Clostridia bacterium]